MKSTDPNRVSPLVGMISNPHSRRNRSQLSAVSSMLATCPQIHHRISQTEEEISKILTEFYSLGINTLAINGGDGSVAGVLTELFNQHAFENPPQLILLPGGTTNMNVGDVGCRCSLKKSIERLIQWIKGETHNVELIKRAVLQVEHSESGKSSCGMFFGTGVITRGIDYCHKHVHTLGLTDEIGPGVVVLRTLWGMLRKEPYFTAPIPIKITLGQSAPTQQQEVVLLIASTLERLFLGLRPYWGKEEGTLHCSWIRQPHQKLVRVFPSLLRGRPNRLVTEENGYFSHNGACMQLWMDGSYTLDGEIYHADKSKGPITISSSNELYFLRL